MKEEGDVFKKFRDSFSRMEGHFHILEQRVPVELQMEYFKYSENVRKENRPPRPLSEDECETLYNTLLTEETTDKTEKRYLLSQLATSKSVRAYRLLEEYTQHPDPEVTDWAYMALMESRISLESDFSDEKQIYISTGLGGKGEKLRFYVLMTSKGKKPFQEYQRQTIEREFAYYLPKTDCEIERLTIGEQYVELVFLIPVRTDIKATLDRVQRMYERSKNHPAIIIWSLGNEAGNGINFERTYDWMKSVEQSRPVQYERAEQQYNTDIYCRMYRSVDELLAYAHQTSPKVYRPFIMTEYLHTMGNSGGGLKEYMEVFESEPVVQGGCIWDWVDQSFREVDAHGKWYWAYGGDYGPENIPSFGNFCCNGLVNAVREPHPHLKEVKKAYQYIKCTLKDPKNLTIAIKNWYDFTNLNAYVLKWSIMGDNGKMLAKGEQSIEVAPHATTEVSLGGVRLPRNIREAYLNLSWTPKKKSAFIGTDDEVAYDQFVLPANSQYRPTLAKLSEKPEIQIDPKTGALTSYIYEGQEYLASPVRLSLYRPATDNDNREKKGGAKVWRKLGLNHLVQRVLSVKTSGHTTYSEVKLLNDKNETIGSATFEYTIRKDGILSVQTRFVPDTTFVSSLARVGLVFEMPHSFNRVTYLGRGEHETYADRKLSGRIGIYHTDAERMFHYYVRPQATGNRTDVRWMQVSDELEKGLSVWGEKPFEFSVSPFTDENIDAAGHINELKRNGTVTVHLDALQSGVGTATCGPGVLAPYLVPVKEYLFSFEIRPLK